MKNKTIPTILSICVGVVVGTLVGNLTKSVPALAFLSYGLNFGTKTPVTLDIGVLSLTAGIQVDLTISCILFCILCVLVGRKLF